LLLGGHRHIPLCDPVSISRLTSSVCASGSDKCGDFRVRRCTRDGLTDGSQPDRH
jgi:hypothetical protein